jgi:hypothetical protein
MNAEAARESQGERGRFGKRNKALDFPRAAIYNGEREDGI